MAKKIKSRVPADMLRPDGSLKGKGFFGELKRPNGGKTTELSIESDGMMFPLVVPTLSKPELDYLLSKDPDPQDRSPIFNSIYDKAYKFALERKKKGLPFFATKEEEGTFKIPNTIVPRANFLTARRDATALRPQMSLINSLKLRRKM